MTTLITSSLQNVFARTSFHSLSKSVYFASLSFLGLISLFHFVFLLYFLSFLLLLYYCIEIFTFCQLFYAFILTGRTKYKKFWLLEEVIMQGSIAVFKLRFIKSSFTILRYSKIYFPLNAINKSFP